MNAGLLSQVTLEDLTGDLRLIAEALGIETARAVFGAFRGCSLNIPSRLPKKTIVRYIRQQAANGKRSKDIAQDLHFTERYIHQVLSNSEP